MHFCSKQKNWLPEYRHSVPALLTCGRAGFREAHVLQTIIQRSSGMAQSSQNDTERWCLDNQISPFRPNLFLLLVLCVFSSLLFYEICRLYLKGRRTNSLKLLLGCVGKAAESCIVNKFFIGHFFYIYAWYCVHMIYIFCIILRHTLNKVIDNTVIGNIRGCVASFCKQCFMHSVCRKLYVLINMCWIFLHSVALLQLCALFSADKSFCNLNHLREFLLWFHIT